MAQSNAWKTDAEGYYIEMLAGEKKKYTLDFTDELAGDTIGSVVWTMHANVTKLSQSEVSPVAQVTLHASGPAGVWPCSVKMIATTGGVPTDILNFRVVIA